MRIEKFNYNDIEELVSNTYVVSDEHNNAVVIDPSVNNNRICEFITSRGLTLKGVLLTHGHFDHIQGVDILVKTFNVPVYIHYLDEECLTDPYMNCSSLGFTKEIRVEASATTVSDGDVLKLLDEDIVVIHTPFHTKGSVCYLTNNNLLFSGDTLFKMSIGRDDLPGSIPSKRRDSLEKLVKLPKETKVYPGHGVNTTLESELISNRFLLR